MIPCPAGVVFDVAPDRTPCPTELQRSHGGLVQAVTLHLVRVHQLQEDQAGAVAASWVRKCSR